MPAEAKARMVRRSFSEGGNHDGYMYYVYILKRADDSIYVGSTPDLVRRFDEHKEGECISTKNHRPVSLVTYFRLQDRLTARRFEDYLKSGSGRAFRKKHFGF